MSVTVELLGGRGEDLWPPPGRCFAVGPGHTFESLAGAINSAFARWDLAHLSLFTLADGRVVTDDETGDELAAGIGGPLVTALPLDTRVRDVVERGEEFQYTFDLGDGWTHRCAVADDPVDPIDVLGTRPHAPLAYWGWGAIPDQYGRRYEDDDGEGRVPRRPAQPHPMLRGAWPAAGAVREVDLREVRAAVATGDPDRFLDALAGAQVDDVLQQVSAGLLLALRERRDRAGTVALSIANRLSMREWPGDRELVDDLVADLRQEASPRRAVPIDLEELVDLLHGDPGEGTGVYVDLRTGEVMDGQMTDPMVVGEDEAVDVEQEPDRWLWLEKGDHGDGWQDMVDFAAHQVDQDLRARLQEAAQGAGAFGRFRRAVADEQVADRWLAFSADRRWGRARVLLAQHGVRVG